MPLTGSFCRPGPSSCFPFFSFSLLFTFLCFFLFLFCYCFHSFYIVFSIFLICIERTIIFGYRDSVGQSDVKRAFPQTQSYDSDIFVVFFLQKCGTLLSAKERIKSQTNLQAVALRPAGRKCYRRQLSQSPQWAHPGTIPTIPTASPRT